MRARHVLIGLVLLLVTAGTHSARATTVYPDRFPADPVLAGGRAVWVERAPQGAVQLVAAPDGHDPRVIQLVRPDQAPAGQYLSVALAASDETAVVQTYASTNNGFGAVPDYTELLAGSPDGPLQTHGRCRGEGVPLRSVDASGGAFVWRQCDGGLGHVEIRDSTVGAPAAAAVGQGGFGARIAGRYVAWLDGDRPYTGLGSANETDIVVYDRIARAEVYRIPRDALPGPVQSLDIQEDGKLAFAYQVTYPTRTSAVGWASISEPSVHRLPLAPMGSYDVHIADDRIAFQRGKVIHGIVVPNAEIGISDLAGNTSTVARGTDDLLFQESFDYDGRRVISHVLGCERRKLIIRSATYLAASTDQRRCPLKLLRRPVYRRGVVTLRLGCGALLPPCGFNVRLRTAGHHSQPLGKDTSNSPNPVRVKLSPSARRLLARRGMLRLAIAADLFDGVGRPSIRRTTAILRK
jgi:hypothetical protein